MSSLITILNEHVLFEGRKEDVMAKYPNVDKDYVEQLSQGDPSGNNKYLDWMVGQYAEGFEMASIIRIVELFHNKSNLINKKTVEEYISLHSNDWRGKNSDTFIKAPKDIKSFPNLSLLDSFTRFLNELVSRKQLDKELKSEADRIYEDSDIIVLSPKTKRASCHYGKHSTWCVATDSDYFNRYSKDGVLYFFISKKNVPITPNWADETRNQAAGEPPFKTALLLRDNGDISWWSKGDRNYTDGWVGDPKLPFLTQEIADRIMSHNGKAIKERSQRELELVLTSKNFYKRSGDSTLKNNFNNFVKKGIITDDQAFKVVLNDNWLALYEDNSNGESLRQILGPKRSFALLEEMLTKTSSSDFVELLSDLSSENFPSTFDLTEEESRQVASIIVKKLGKKPSTSEAGGQIKMFVDKWTMTPEEWNKYNTTSQYFLIGKKEPPMIEKIVKVDRFDLNSHKTISNLMLEVRYKQKQNIGLYGLTTEKDALDEYVGSSSSEIPESVVNMIMEKSKKIG